MPLRLTRSAAVAVTVLVGALALAPAAGAETMNLRVPVEDFVVGNVCNGEEVHLQGTLHLVQQGGVVEDAPRQHEVVQINSQRLTGVGLLTGDRYNVNWITKSIFNAHIDGANVTTGEAMINVVSRRSGVNFQVQTVFHVTENSNGEATAAFQNFHVHCTG
jgi:hypothetical protein